MDRENRIRQISGFELKLIAVITMLIDHVAAALLYRILDTNGVFPVVDDHWDAFWLLYRIMRGIGRMAFPIYCFLLVEGFEHTRSVWKYAGRLFLFALLSEIPFDMAFNRTYLETKSNNVFWTLLVGLLMMIVLRFVEQRTIPEAGHRSMGYILYFMRAILYMTVVLGCMGIAEFVLQSDYGAAGIAAIAAIYLLKNHPIWALGTAVVLLALMSSTTEIYALLMLLPVWRYNGERGRQMKYFFYWFYPVHLLLIVAVAYGLGVTVV